MATLHVLRVFVDADGSGGNPLGVFVEGSRVPAGHRQRIAADLGFSETVFVLDADGAVRIHTPLVELPFAGHPLVGAGWLLTEVGGRVDVLHPPAGPVPTWRSEGDQWIRGRADWAPAMELRRYATADEVDRLDGVPDGMVDAWAWLDEAAGLVRSRVFAPGAGIAEDEATGSAAARLVTELDRPVRIRQGSGSRLLARPGPEGTAEVGGRVVLDEVRGYPLS